MGSEAEFTRLLKEVISISSGSGLYLSDVEEFIEKSKGIPHYAVRRAAWVLSKYTTMKFLGMEVIPQKSQETIWPAPLLGTLKQHGYRYEERDELTLRGFYNKYKASIGTSKVDLIYELRDIVRLIEVKSYGPLSGEFRLREGFSPKDLETYIKKSDELYRQLVFMAILPTFIERLRKAKVIRSYYYLKPEEGANNRFFEVKSKTHNIDDLLKK